MNQNHVRELSFGGKTVRLSLPAQDDLLQRRIRRDGVFYELEMLEHLRHLVRPGEHVLDVGASFGNHTVFLAAICGAQVLAFEPQAGSVATLRESLALNGLEQQVRVFEFGLGASAGRADLVCADASNLGSVRLQVAAAGEIEVRAYDELGLDHAIRVVKIDVENMEREVLLGMARMLEAHRPVLYVEIQDPAQVMAIQGDLDRFGYALVECFNSTPTYCFMPAVGAQQQFEALMARLDAVLRLRLRAQSATLAPVERGPAVDKLVQIGRRLDTLEQTSAAIRDALQKLQQRVEGAASAAGAQQDRDARQHETKQRELERKQDREQIAQAVAALVKPLQVKLNGLQAQVDRTLREARQTNRYRLLPKFVALVLRPRQVMAAVWKRLPWNRGPQPLPAPSAASASASVAPAAPHTELVSVVMTTHDSAGFVEQAVRSILDQTYRHLELIVVDDASSDDTLAVLSRLQGEDERVRVLRCYVNRGTYWAKNLGLLHARGIYVTTQDSDDTSTPDRIERQLQALRRGGPQIIATCNYVRVDDAGEVVLNRGLRERLGLITLMFEKDVVLPRIGYFDSVRTSADAEFLQRMRKVFPREAFAHVDEPLYVARTRAGSLSSRGVALDVAANDGDFLSDDRKAYVQSYEAWHAAVDAPRIAFPLRRRPFDAPQKMLKRCEAGDDYVTVSLASIPSRQSGLMRVVQSLIDQVDMLNVYLNHYESVPAFLAHPRIRVVRSQDHGDQRDNGKMWFVEHARSGYYFTVDDDIAYPPNYVSYLTAKLKQYGNAVVVGLHGTIMAPDQERFFDIERRTVLSFKHALDEDRQVHVLGTGTTAWHTSALQLSVRDFRSTGMADLWLAVKAQRGAVPMIAVARPAGFLRPLDDLAPGSLFEEYAERDDEQTRIYQAQKPWTLPAVPEPAVLAGKA